MESKEKTTQTALVRVMERAGLIINYFSIGQGKHKHAEYEVFEL